MSKLSGLVWLAAAACVLRLADGQASTLCMNDCSGRGRCDAKTMLCQCFDSFTGPDCSYVRCPNGTAWIQKAAAVDTDGDLHNVLAECSGVGTCESSTGKCQCPPGYTGNACEKTVCPEDCNGAGRCVDMSTLAYRFGPDADNLYAGTGFHYTGWEAQKIFGCVCNWGFSGPSCANLNCPRGDSPYTDLQQRKVVRMLVDTTDILGRPNAQKAIRLTFAGMTTTDKLVLPTATRTSCLRWLNSLRNINATDSDCWVARGTSNLDGSSALGLNQVEIMLSLGFRNDVDRTNNLFSFNGDPPITSFRCDFEPIIDSSSLVNSFCSMSPVDVNKMTMISALPAVGTTYTVKVTNTTSVPNRVSVLKVVQYTPVTSFTYQDIAMTADAGVGTDLGDGTKVYFPTVTGHTLYARWTITSKGVASPGFREYDVCSGAGLCVSGSCKCGEGHSGTACQNMAASNSSATGNTNEPTLKLLADNYDYSGNVLELAVSRPSSSSFDFITAYDSNNQNIFNVRGDGYLTAGSVSFTTGAGIDGGTRAYMSSTMASSNAPTPALDVNWGSSSTAPTNGVVRISSSVATDSTSPAASNYHLLKVRAISSTATPGVYTDVFTITGDGKVSISSSSPTAFSGGSVTDGGMIVRDAASPSTTITTHISRLNRGVYADASAASSLTSVLEGLGPSSGNYKLLSLRNANGMTFAIDQAGAVTSTTTIPLSTAAASGSSNAGSIMLSTGDASTGTGNAGDVSFIASGAASGKGGSLIGITGDSSTGSAGGVTLVGGAGTLSGNGGTVSLAAGSANTGIAGSVMVRAGGVNGANAAGSITLAAGASAGSGAGGVVSIGGGASNGGLGGTVTIRGGPSSSTNGGDVLVQPGSGSAASTNGNIELRDTSGVARFRMSGSGGSVSISGTTEVVINGPNSASGIKAIGGVVITDKSTSPTMTTQISGGTTTGVSVGVTSFPSTPGFVADLSGPTTGTYTMLRMTGASSATLTVDQSGDVTSSDSFTLATSSSSTMAGNHIVLNTGSSAVGSGATGSVSLRAGTASGASSTGGSVVLNAGGGVATGGSVSLTAGTATAATSTGGSLYLRPGGGGGSGFPGNIELRDSLGVARVRVGGSGGSVSVTGTTEVVLTGPDSLLSVKASGGAVITDKANSPTMTTQISGGTTTGVSVAVTSFTSTGFVADLTGPTTGTYTMLRMTGASSAALTVDQSGDITSSDSLNLVTASPATTAATDIAIATGSSTINGGSTGSISLKAGSTSGSGTTTGGSVVINAGGAGSTAGSVRLTAGTATGVGSTGGSVIAQAGAGGVGGTNGNIELRDTNGVARFRMSGSGGSVSITGSSEVVLMGPNSASSVKAVGGMTIQDKASSVTMTTQIAGGTTTGISVGVTSFPSLPGFVADMSGPASGTYTLLRLTGSGSSTLTVDSSADVTSSDSLSVSTSAPTGTSGTSMTLTTGGSTVAGGATGGITLQAGTASGTGTTAGGDITLNAGAAGTTAGSLRFNAGAATGPGSTGGSIVLQVGDKGLSGSPGTIELRDASTTPRIRMSGNGGSVSITGTSEVVLTGPDASLGVKAIGGVSIQDKSAGTTMAATLAGGANKGITVDVTSFTSTPGFVADMNGPTTGSYTLMRLKGSNNAGLVVTSAADIVSSTDDLVIATSNPTTTTGLGVTINTGSSTVASGAAGNIVLQPGTSAAGLGGNIVLWGGGGTSTGGDITMRVGSPGADVKVQTSTQDTIAYFGTTNGIGLGTGSVPVRKLILGMADPPAGFYTELPLPGLELSLDCSTANTRMFYTISDARAVSPGAVLTFSYSNCDEGTVTYLFNTQAADITVGGLFTTGATVTIAAGTAKQFVLVRCVSGSNCKLVPVQ